MYIADISETAIAEVRYHQEGYWQNVTGLHYDRVVFKELICTFDVDQGLDATGLPANDPIYDRADYGQSRLLGREIKGMPEVSTLKYVSVRKAGGICHALFTPRGVTDLSRQNTTK